MDVLNQGLDFRPILETQHDIANFCSKNKVTCSTTSIFIVLGAIRSLILGIQNARGLFGASSAIKGILRACFFTTSVPSGFFVVGSLPIWHGVSESDLPYRIFSPSLWLGKLNELAVMVGMNDFQKFKADLTELYRNNSWAVILVGMFFIVGMTQRSVLKSMGTIFSYWIRMTIKVFSILNVIFRRALFRRTPVHFIPLMMFTIG